MDTYSGPRGHSVNDGIPKDLCSLSYITIDDAVNHILELGCGTHLAKIDIKNALGLYIPAGISWECNGKMAYT